MGTRSSCEQVDLHQSVSGRIDSPLPGDTEKMPGRVFDVVGIDGLVQFKLSPALVEFAGVIVANAALPELRRDRRVELGRAVEVPNRFGDFVLAEVPHADELDGCGPYRLAGPRPSEAGATGRGRRQADRRQYFEEVASHQVSL